MTARACPHPFPFRWHRTMAEVMANEATDCDQIRDAVVAFIADSSMENGRTERAFAEPIPVLTEHPVMEGDQLMAPNISRSPSAQPDCDGEAS